MGRGEDVYGNYYDSPEGQMTIRAQNTGSCNCAGCRAERKRAQERKYKKLMKKVKLKK